MVDISSYQNAPNLAIHVNLGHYKNMRNGNLTNSTTLKLI